MLKVKPAVKKFLFSNDSDNVDPERICQICKRIIENINKEYRHDLKNQKDDYSHEENINDKVKKAEETHELFKSKSNFKPHEEHNCKVCQYSSNESSRYLGLKNHNTVNHTAMQKTSRQSDKVTKQITLVKPKPFNKGSL